ncbi:MAG: hypothetical protein WCT42_00170 [Candidatus Paceibacterota bacterium]
MNEGLNKNEAVKKDENTVEKQKIRKVVSDLIENYKYTWFLPVDYHGNDEDADFIDREVSYVPDEKVESLKNLFLEEFPVNKEDKSWENDVKNGGRYQSLIIKDPKIVKEFVNQLSKEELEKINFVADVDKAVLYNLSQNQRPENISTSIQNREERIEQDSVKKGFNLYLSFALKEKIENKYLHFAWDGPQAIEELPHGEK